MPWWCAALVLVACAREPVPREREVARWPGAPSGFEPMSMPGPRDPCEGRTVFVGTDSIAVDPPPRGPGTPRPHIQAGVEREMAELLPALDVLAMTHGAYNGPGGEPHVRWTLGQETVVIAFDRRVERARMWAAIRGAPAPYSIVRVGGIHDGVPVCALVLIGVPEDYPPTSDGGLHLVPIDTAAAPPALVRAVALARAGDDRYPVLVP